MTDATPGPISDAARLAEQSPLTPLALRAVGGDVRALERVLHGLVARTRNLVRYLVRGDRDVDDIAQVALLAIARGLPTYQGRGRLESWADRVVARATFAEIRRRAAGGAVPVGPYVESLPSEDLPAPYDYIARRRVVRLLDQLSTEQRSAIVLHHVLEMSVPEIARETGVPDETVRSRLRLGKARLRALGADLLDEEERGHA
jgi:RNA polymerase sigma-70 factor (ECF subfamily)